MVSVCGDGLIISSEPGAVVSLRPPPGAGLSSIRRGGRAAAFAQKNEGAAQECLALQLGWLAHSSTGVKASASAALSR
eukprot:GSA120T00000718001.1